MEFHRIFYCTDDKFPLEGIEDLPLIYYNSGMKVGRGISQLFQWFIVCADDEIRGGEILRQSKTAVWNGTGFG